MEKNYVGSGFKKTFNNGTEVVNLNINLTKLQQLPTTSDKNGNQWVKLTVGQRHPDSQSTSPATHSIWEDTYNKGNNQNNYNNQSPKQDLPF